MGLQKSRSNYPLFIESLLKVDHFESQWIVVRPPLSWQGPRFWFTEEARKRDAIKMPDVKLVMGANRANVDRLLRGGPVVLFDLLSDDRFEGCRVVHCG